MSMCWVCGCPCVLCACACGMCAVCACLVCMWEVCLQMEWLELPRWRQRSKGGASQKGTEGHNCTARIPSSGSEGKRKEGFKKKHRPLGGQGRVRVAAPSLVRIKAGQKEGNVQNCSLPLGVRPRPCSLQLVPVWMCLLSAARSQIP